MQRNDECKPKRTIYCKLSPTLTVQTQTHLVFMCEVAQLFWLLNMLFKRDETQRMHYMALGISLYACQYEIIKIVQIVVFCKIWFCCKIPAPYTTCYNKSKKMQKS